MSEMEETRWDIFVTQSDGTASLCLGHCQEQMKEVKEVQKAFDVRLEEQAAKLKKEVQQKLEQSLKSAKTPRIVRACVCVCVSCAIINLSLMKGHFLDCWTQRP